MELTSFWKIAASATCVAVICGTAILWQVSKQKAIQRKLAEDASVSRMRAEQGDPEAQYDLASMYFRGKGVPQDYAEAVRWYRKAAEKGYTRAENALGYVYYQGKGVPQDDAEAVRWFRKAADHGDANAQSGLAFMYSQGKGMPQDYAEAVRWYSKAADQGDANAQYALGFMYRNGKGVPHDDAEAVRWFRKAADHGDAQAQRALASMRRVALARWVIIVVFFLATLLLVTMPLRRWGRATWVPWALTSALCFTTQELLIGSSTALLLAQRLLGARYSNFRLLIIVLLGGSSVICGLWALVEIARGSKRGAASGGH